MIEEYSTGVWWIDGLAVFGVGFLSSMPVLFAVWMLRDRLRWRRQDADDLARLSPKAKDTEQVTT